MIKCNLNVCATISRAATVKTGKDGNEFLSMIVKLMIPGRDGKKKELEISVSLNGDKSKAPVYVLGRRVKINGDMTVRKKEGNIYYNMRATRVELANSKDEDSIDGTMDFIGKVSQKGIELKENKKGNPYKVFSAFSVSNNNDKAEFIWVRFIYFNPKDDESWLVPGVYVHVNGKLKIGAYNDSIYIDCNVSTIEQKIFNN